MLGQQLPCVTIDERDLPRLSNGDQSLREMLAHSLADRSQRQD